MKTRCFIALLLWASPVWALEVREAVWGFDGQAVPERFNLLSVLVQNDSPKPFDGTLRLYKTYGVGTRVGAGHVQPCYLAPFSARWMQFYPYVSQETAWRVTWGARPTDGTEIHAPMLGAPACVALHDPESPLPPVTGFKAFPDVLFPTSVAATDGLDSLLLDYAPRWEPAKRAAFLDWLRQGGTVHVLLAADGQYPVFADELAILNSPLDRTRVGAGQVVRHNVAGTRMTPTWLPQAGFSPLQLKKSRQLAIYQLDDLFFNTLATLSRPNHHWGLIYLLAAMYVVAVGPGNYLWGKRRRDYRWSILSFFVLVGGCGLLFGVVGRRGQGENNTVHTLAYARWLGGDSYNVRQWIKVFTTRGAQYVLTHAAPHNYYAIGQEQDEVAGDIYSGKDGRLVVDIPVFAHRSLVHQARLTGPPVSLDHLSVAGGQNLRAFSIELGRELSGSLITSWVVHQTLVYPLRLVNGRLELGMQSNSPVVVIGMGQSLADALSRDKLQQVQFQARPYTRYGQDVEKLDEPTRYGQLALPLFAFGLGGTDGLQYRIESSTSDANRLQLFVFARSPESFRLADPRFRQQTGYVLYHFEFTVPES